MPLEIERKFLVNNDVWNAVVKPKGTLYRQGYILMEDDKTIRIRTSNDDAFLTIKGKTNSATRPEFEYQIPLTEAKEMLDLFSLSELSKTRYEVSHNDKLWVIDVFHGDNEGLIVAEIELQSEEEKFDLPDWILGEVTNEAKYYNSNLTIKPFKQW